jgi:hypothetical protein
MSADEIVDTGGGAPAPDAPFEPPSRLPEVASHLADALDAESLQANLSVIGTVHARQMEAVGSVIGFTSAERDATITASMTPIVHAKGDIHVRQSYTSGVIAGGDMEISQSVAPVIVGKKLSVTQGGGVVMLSGEADVNSGFVGVLLTPKANVSADSRILLSTKGALIIAAAILGGFGLVAVMMALSVRRVMAWRRKFHAPDMPDFSHIAEKIRHSVEHIH